MSYDYGISTNWKTDGNLATQLQSKYGLNPLEAKQVSYDYGKSGNSSFNDFAASNPTLSNALNTAPVTGYDANQLSALSNPEFTTYAGEMGVDLTGASTDQLNNTMSGFESSQGLGDFTSQDFGNYASGIGALGQVGLGALSYLENSKTADKQRALLDQQLASNAINIKNLAADRSHVQNVFKK